MNDPDPDFTTKSTLDLLEWLDLKGRSIAEFARQIGYSRSHLSQIAHKRLEPSSKLVKIITRWTKGKVKLK
jgi:transcriptional regulator with XRE-family HTH domain